MFNKRILEPDEKYSYYNYKEEFMFSKYISIGLIVTMILSIGCVDKDVSSVVNSIPEVQQYLKEHPEAKITATYWTKDEISKSIDEITRQCDRTISPTDMYKIIVQEKNLKIISWIEANSRKLVCSFSEGEITTEISTPTVTEISTPTVTEISTPTVIEISTPNIEDKEFLSLIEEANDVISNDISSLPDSNLLPNDDYFKKIKIYGELLESDASKYLIKMEKMSVSSKLQYVYIEYKVYLTYIKIAGQYCKIATKYHESGLSDDATLNLKKYRLNMEKAKLAQTKINVYLRKYT